jgi:hypothetical protein
MTHFVVMETPQVSDVSMIADALNIPEHFTYSLSIDGSKVWFTCADSEVANYNYIVAFDDISDLREYIKLNGWADE